MAGVDIDISVHKPAVRRRQLAGRDHGTPGPMCGRANALAASVICVLVGQGCSLCPAPTDKFRHASLCRCEAGKLPNGSVNGASRTLSKAAASLDKATR